MFNIIHACFCFVFFTSSTFEALLGKPVVVYTMKGVFLLRLGFSCSLSDEALKEGKQSYSSWTTSFRIVMGRMLHG